MAQLLVRNVPDDMKQWLSDAIPVGLSQNEFLLRILEGARAGNSPTLFDRPTLGEPSLPNRIEFSFIDLFAGIGGFRIGMTMNGGRCVFTSEWDRYSQKTYREWYREENIWGDINDPALQVEDMIPDHDVLCGGFPCQPFSIAGVSKKNSLGMAHGFECEKQGNLFFRICEIIDVKRPPVVFLENVKNLRSHDKGNTWRVIRTNLEQRHYKVFADVIDARAWVPQHRERFFIVGFDRHLFGDEPPFVFPDSPQRTPVVGDILEEQPDPKYTLTNHLWNYLQAYAQKHKAKGNGFGFGLVDRSSVARTLSARYYKDGSEILIKQKGKNPRRLTHREAARLMGYTDEYARMFGHPDGFPIVVSDTQAYKQFGNSVVPAVIDAIGREIVKVMNWQLRRSGGTILKSGVVSGRRRARAVAV